MSRKRRNRPTERSDEFDEPSVPRPRRTKRLMRRLGLLLLLVGAALAAAPTIVGRTSLRDSLLAKALPPGWSIASEQASLGWMSSQTLVGLKIADGEGRPLLAADSITVPKSLLSLAVSQADLGKLVVERPTAFLALRPDGSNWEDFVVALQAQHTQPSTAPLTLQVEIVEGVVQGFDSTTGQQWTAERANLVASVEGAVDGAIDLNGSAELATEQARGTLNFRMQPQDAEGQQLELLAERLPLRPLESLLARFAPGTQLSGVLSTDAKVRWQTDPQRGLMLQSTGRMEANQLDVSAYALNGDRLRSQKIVAPWSVSVAGDQITIEQLSVGSDWANLEASGALRLAELQSLSIGNLPDQPSNLSGNVDLAQLAAMLPRTLQLREGVRIDAGRLEFEAGATDNNGTSERLVWQATAAVQNVAGSDGQREIRWQQPIEAAVKLRDSELGTQLQSLTLSAPFVEASLRTANDGVRGNFEVDLAQFSQELSQFVDLQSWQMRGLGEGSFTVNRLANQQFEAKANVELTDLNVNEDGRQVWIEPKLEVELSATGSEQDFVPRSINTGQVNLRGPRDQVEVAILAPINLDDKQQPWQLQLTGNGPLALWASRMRPWVSTLPNQLEGDAEVTAQLHVSRESVRVVESQGSVAQLRVQSDSFSIDEPRVEFAGDAYYDFATGILRTQEMQLLASSLSGRAREVDIAWSALGSPAARGNVAFRADLERVASMAKLVGGSTATWPRGAAVGQVQFSSDDTQLSADFGVKVEQLQLLHTTASAGAAYGRPEVVWTEPLLELTGAAKYGVVADRIDLENLQVQGKTLKFNSSASIDRVSSEGLLSASGLVEYDPNELAKLVASYAGQNVQLQGDRQVRFEVLGPMFAPVGSASAHWSQRWNVTSEAGWSSAGVYGLPLGGGRLAGSLREGQLTIAPLDIAVGQGRLTAAPSIQLSSGAQRLTLPSGPLVTNVEISPAVSEKMLKYVAPILAGATRAEGQFSIDLAQAEVPLEQPKMSRVQGRLMTHRLNVSPGPMMNQLIAVVKQLESLAKHKQFLQAVTAPKTKSFLTMTEQQVDFQVVDGRVYHRNLEFLVDDAPVRSRGSVGFDQTLALEIEVPIQDKWIASEPALRSFAGQSIRLPIYGTFQNPKIDERAVADISAKLLKGAATQALGDELNRQFEKLFGR